MKKHSLILILLALVVNQALADRIYLLNQPGYNTAGPEIIAAIQANGHTVVSNSTDFNLPAGFTSTCVDAVNGYDWLCLFGEADYSSVFSAINDFINVGGKVYCQYEVSCCTTSSSSTAALLAFLTSLPITPNANDYIALGGQPAFSGPSPGDCYVFAGNAYKGLDGVPAANQYVATLNIGGSSPDISVCTNFGFHMSGSEIQGDAGDGTIVGVGDVNILFIGAEPGNVVDPLFIDYFWPVNTSACQSFQADCTIEPDTEFLGLDTLLCENDVLLLNASAPGGTYVWQDGSTQPSFTVTLPGIYWVDVTSNNGFASDTITVDYEYLTTSISSDVTICAGQSTNLLASGGTSYLWSPAATLNNAQIAGPVASPVATTTYSVTISGQVCQEVLPVTVTVTPADIQYESAITPEICTVAGELILQNITGGFPPFQVEINGITEADSSLVPAAAGIYPVAITDALGCVVTTSIEVPDGSYVPDFTVDHIDPLCNVLGSIDVSNVLNATLPVTYELNGAVQAGPQFSDLGPGNYQVAVVDANGCTDSQPAVLILTENDITFTVTAVQPVCNTPGSLAVSNTQGGITPYTTTINGAPLLNGLADGLDAGNYTIIVEDSAGCTISQAPTLQNIPNDFVIDVTPAASICDTPGYIESLQVTGAGNDYTVVVDGQDYETDMPLESGPHSMTVTDADGCVETMPFVVDEVNTTDAIISADPLVGYYPLHVTFVSNSINAQEFIWDFGNGQGATDQQTDYTYMLPDTYIATLTAIDTVNGCMDTTMVGIWVKPVNSIFLPNAFTPDEDGVNEVFGVYGDGILDTDYSLKIFNRWGELVWEGANPNAYWSGQVRDGDHYSPNGVYVYRLTYRFTESVSVEHLEGHVLLVR